MDEKKKVIRKRRGKKIVRREEKPRNTSHKATRKPTLIGYMRVSTEYQDHALQYDAMIGAGVDPENIFQDTMSGKKITREGLQKCLKYVIPGDTILVWKVDRFSRKMRDMLNLIEDLQERGIGLRSITQPFDTTTPAGKMMLQMLAMFAEFERETIRERVIAGIHATRAANKSMRWGKKPAADYDPVEIRRLKREGKKVREIRAITGVSIATISRVCNSRKKRKKEENA